MLSPFRSSALLLSFPLLSLSREIVFPPLSGYQNEQIPVQPGSIFNAQGSIKDGRISGAKFAGLTTFANLPYVHCLAADGADVERFDIAFLGAPFDTGVTSRPGARYGPGGIRIGSKRMEPDQYNIYTGKSAYHSWAKVVDCGDAPLTFLDNTVALKQLEEAHKASRATNSSDYTRPRIITLGGDHTTTLSALRSTAEQWGPVSVIHFDSHIDTWDPKVIGGGVSHYAGVNHGTFLHIAHEEGLIRNTSIHAGIRAPVMRPRGDIRNDVRCGFDMVKAREIDRIGIDGVVERLKQRVGDSRVYVSVDIDVLDPAFAPATGTAEPGGWSSRELLSILDGLSGLDVIGADIVEVSPIWDNAGETTVLAAAQVADSLLTLMVQTPVKSKAEELW
ncbi:agmatinase 1 [Diplodia corticola]|uniref:Agmatinase 1 n=1 Tax=Diplodia corticola TaxID=236234 RepID=A0A1J9S4S2_9PEZI|nr:agmatinase 1 [Diplodia corticola]OJD35527.1 agmatinase 1 [Diplodia corticola]